MRKSYQNPEIRTLHGRDLLERLGPVAAGSVPIEPGVIIPDPSKPKPGFGTRH